MCIVLAVACYELARGRRAPKEGCAAVDLDGGSGKGGLRRPTAKARRTRRDANPEWE